MMHEAMTLRHNHPPRLDSSSAARLAREHWNIRAMATPLPGERDRNFRLISRDGATFVLKLAAAGEDPRLLECQHAVTERLAGACSRFVFPRPVAARSGETILTVRDDDDVPHLARVLEHVPGVSLVDVRSRTPALLREVGALLGTITRALASFEHEAAERTFHWDLRRGRAVINECLGDVADAGTRARIEHFLPLLDARAPLFDTLRTSVIHGDANDHNVLVVTADGRVPAVSGIIDFGDVVRSWTIGELAIGCAYAMLGEPDPLAAAAEVVAGHHEVAPIPEHELEALFPLICTRLCVSAVLAAHQRAAHPDNDYLSISEAPVRALLGRLIEVDAADDHERLLAAAPP